MEGQQTDRCTHMHTHTKRTQFLFHAKNLQTGETWAEYKMCGRAPGKLQRDSHNPFKALIYNFH